MNGQDSIKVDQFLPHPPARVWQALTDPRQLARWLMPNTFQPRVGHRFTLGGGEHGLTQGQVLELDPGRLLRISWANGPLDTVVTMRLVPEGTGTRLLLEHTGFDTSDAGQRAAHSAMDRGWKGSIMQALEHALNTMSKHQPDAMATGH